MLLTALVNASAPPPDHSAGALIVYHPASGKVLLAHNADDPMLVASTTKLMTALVAVQRGDPDAVVVIREEWTRVEGSSMYLKAGEECTLRELLQGLLLASGNDAALALAGFLAGDTETFVGWMNEKASELGLCHTHFENPHGLDAPNHFSSAADLAVIMSNALRNPLLREIMGLTGCTVLGRRLVNHNKLLRSCDGVFAGKTGYTKDAGRCLVSCCSRGGMELICVTLSDPNDWRDHQTIYDWAYSSWKEVTLDPHKALCTVPVMNGSSEEMRLAPAEEIRICVPVEAQVEIRLSHPPFLLFPVSAGEEAGSAEIRCGEETLERAPLVCMDDNDLGSC